MRSTHRKLLSSFVLAIYVGISVLGQGLHWLSPDDGHHHKFHVIGCATHGHAHESSAPAGKVLSANDCVADSHACGICEFLLLAIGQPPQPAAPLISQPLVVAVPSPRERIYSSTAISLHAPRGPPQLLA